MNRRALLEFMRQVQAEQPTEVVLPVQFDKTSDTTLANVAGSTGLGLRVWIEANVAYRIKSHLFLTVGSTGLAKVALNAAASPTTFLAAIKYIDFTTPGVTGGRQTTLGTGVAVAVAQTSFEVEIEGVIQPVTSGLLAVQFAQSVSNGTASSVLVGSWLQVTPIGRRLAS